MREVLVQVISNLRANKLRSFLTMFGILWGVISVVVLSATGEGFQRGNQHVLEELGRNVGIVWGNRTSLQAGGQRAGRQIRLTVDDALSDEDLVGHARLAGPVVDVARGQDQVGRASGSEGRGDRSEVHETSERDNPAGECKKKHHPCDSADVVVQGPGDSVGNQHLNSRRDAAHHAQQQHFPPDTHAGCN